MTESAQQSEVPFLLELNLSGILRPFHCASSDCFLWRPYHLLPLLHLRQKFRSLCVAGVGTEWEVECADGYVSGETEPDETVSWLKTIVVSQREQNWKAGFAEDNTSRVERDKKRVNSVKNSKMTCDHVTDHRSTWISPLSISTLIFNS